MIALRQIYPFLNLSDEQSLNPPGINGYYLDIYSNVGLVEDDETQKFIVSEVALNEKDIDIYFERKIKKPFSLRWKSYIKIEKNGYYSFRGFGKNGGYKKIYISFFHLN